MYDSSDEDELRADPLYAPPGKTLDTCSIWAEKLLANMGLL